MRPKKSVPCTYCGNTITRSKSLIDRTTKHFCNKDCRNKNFEKEKNEKKDTY